MSGRTICRFEAGIFIPAALPFQGGHLAIILGNLLENALESCQKLPANQIYIFLEATYVKEMLQIYIKKQQSRGTEKDSNGRYPTTKDDTRCHGIGLASVKQALAAYNGELIIGQKYG